MAGAVRLFKTLTSLLTWCLYFPFVAIICSPHIHLSPFSLAIWSDFSPVSLRPSFSRCDTDQWILFWSLHRAGSEGGGSGLFVTEGSGGEGFDATECLILSSKLLSSVIRQKSSVLLYSIACTLHCTVSTSSCPWDICEMNRRLLCSGVPLPASGCH